MMQFLVPDETLVSEDYIQEENEDRIDELESENDDLQYQIDELEDENDDLQLQVDELESENEKLSEDWIRDRVEECFENDENISFENKDDFVSKICEILDIQTLQFLL